MRKWNNHTPVMQSVLSGDALPPGGAYHQHSLNEVSEPNLLFPPYHKDSNLLQSGELGLREGCCPPCCVGEELDRRTEHLSITALVPAHPQPFPRNLEGSHSTLHFHETAALPKEWNVSSRTLLILNTLKKKITSRISSGTKWPLSSLPWGMSPSYGAMEKCNLFLSWPLRNSSVECLD